MIDSIVLILASAFLFLYFAYNSKDYTTFIFSSIAFFFAGLGLITNNYYGFGWLIIGFGFYIGLRSGIELIKEEFEKLWQKRKLRKQQNQATTK